jgi:hypothetical protein
MNCVSRKLFVAILISGIATSAFAAEVDRREANQQARIANGINSGQLTPGETARLERQEAAIHQEIRADRAANGGKLTRSEKAQINHQQNRVSNEIYRAKHNAKHM